MKHSLHILIVALIGLFGCDKTNNADTALLELFQKEKALNCKLMAMRDSISGEWDNINHLLSDKLPSDMPEEERTNMLKVRNASLIRMFQSFDKVDEEVKLALQKTEEMDIEMTKRITVLKKEAYEIESQKHALFEEVSQDSGAEAVARFKNINNTLLSEACQ